MTDAPATPESASGAEDGKPRSFMVWTGKRHVFRVRVPEHYWLAAHVHLIGDVPALEHDVKILDPDTGDVIAEATTDDEGVVRVEVPQNKEYRIELVDPQPEEEVEVGIPPGAIEEEGAMLRCQFVRASGEPLADTDLFAKLDEIEVVITTDGDGRIELPAHLGVYELTYGEQKFYAHGLPASDSEDEHAVYHFVVEESGAEGEAGGEESGDSAASIEERLPREHEHEPEHEEEPA